MDEKRLNEIRYVMAMASNQLAKDGHDEMSIDLDDMRALLLALFQEDNRRINESPSEPTCAQPERHFAGCPVARSTAPPLIDNRIGSNFGKPVRGDSS